MQIYPEVSANTSSPVGQLSVVMHHLP